MKKSERLIEYLPPNITPITPRLLRIPQVAQYLGATNWFAETLIRDGKIPAIKMGNRLVVDIRRLDEWIDNQAKAESISS